MKRKLKIADTFPHRLYLPKEIADDGFTGEVEVLADAFTVTILKPGISLEKIKESLELVLRDIELRMKEHIEEE